MTDKYGSNRDQDEASGHDVNEAWHGDQPPVDDFADQGVEETATVSEETEMLEEPEASLAESAQRKGSVVPIAIAGVGGLLLLGALLYWQFGRSEPAAAPTIPPLSTQNNPAPPAFPASPPSVTQTPLASSQGADIASLKPGAPPTTSVAPTTALAPVAVSTSAPAMPAAAAVSPSAAISGLPPALATDVAAAKVVSPPAPGAGPAALVSPPSVAVVKAPVVAAPVVAAPIAVPPAAPVAKDATLDARLNNLSTHVEDLQKSLAQATQQLNQVTNMIAAAPPPSHANADTNERLSKIEQQLTELQHATALVAHPRAGAEKTAAADTSLDMTPSAAKPAETQHAAGASQGVHHHATHVTKQAAKRVRHHQPRAKAANDGTHILPEPVPVQQPWVLRAATPDEAWLATNATTRELRHIRVGDTVPGVGQIKAIHQNGDNWVVEGSQATVQ